jgi:hypothetical protein
MIMLTKMTRRVALLLTTGFVVGAVGCNDFLRVQNPGAIEAPDINNPAYIPLLVNGVIGEFQPAFTLVALYSGVFTDELANFHGFPENIDMDVRNVGLGNGTYAGTSTIPGVYNSLQSSRFMADTASVLLRSFLGEAATRDVRLARVLNYAGYSYTLLGEQMCSAPIGGNTIHTSDELLNFALERFKTAIDVATASKAAGGGTPADSMLTLARLGAARVSLDLGKKADAITYASLVPAAFSVYVYHAAANAREVNPFFGAASNGPNAEWVGITNTPFATVTGDPRIPHPVAKEKTQQDSAVVPNSPLAYSTYNGTATGADFTRDAAVRFGSGLEAQYILAEAQGNTAANLTFLNDRRAIGGALPLVAPTEAEFQAALREQRARDLYLANYRMGDLRRYKKLYQVDLWQKGPYVSPVAAPPTFGTQECWPIPLAEYNGNPNLPRP